jgi:hypothetical protein
MESVEAFLTKFFRVRTNLLRRPIPDWEKHISQFFAPEYRPYDRQKAVDDSEAEQITEILGDVAAPEVITTGCTGGHWRARYKLRATGDSWIITRMEMECGICHGSGKAKNGVDVCRLCKGDGWRLVGEHVA